MQLITDKGNPQPLGTKFVAEGCNFAIFSKHASAVTLCLFLDPLGSPIVEIPLSPERNKTGDIWHIFLKHLEKNFYYAYRMDGPKETKSHFDFSKFLLDPFAKAVFSDPDKSRFLGAVDVNQDFDWQGVEKPHIHMNDLIIYEMHVRGFTKSASSQVVNKGLFLGVIEKIPHLLSLGINAVELMPVQEFNREEYKEINPFTHQPLCNYWGYSTINFFSLCTLYTKGNKLSDTLFEFKTLVRELHRNGIEIILDVVFNHTAEGNELGPTLSFKGIDNSIYYILDPKFRYMNFSGCGNTMNCNHPVVADLILEVLRYFVIETKVDGFRFDLASIFSRDQTGTPHKLVHIIDFISQDPILSGVKLIAEPWDATGLYEVGAFYPKKVRWSEWNGQFRDAVRSFLNTRSRKTDEFATRLSGSEDLYHKRAPFTSINFVTSHDGFSLRDLVSYNEKHNLGNGENNRDGSNHNLSRNFGVEGMTEDLEIINVRKRQMRNFHLALMISQGVPLILMGDEYGHTKLGNNNAWCQDNELNWFNWDGLKQNEEFYRFFRKMIEFRNRHALLKKNKFLTTEDVVWHGSLPYHPHFEWLSSFIAFTLIDANSREDLYIAFNAENHSCQVTLPEPPTDKQWVLVANTANESPYDFIDLENRTIFPHHNFEMISHSSIILKAN